MEKNTYDSNDYSDEFDSRYKQYIRLRYLTIIPILLFIGVIFIKTAPDWFRYIAIASLFVVAFINWIYPAIILKCPKCNSKLYPGWRPNFWIRFKNKKYCPNCDARLLK